MLCKIFLGQISNKSEIRYTISNDKILRILGSQRIQVIQAKMYSSESLAALEWKIKNVPTPTNLVSETIKYYEYEDGTVSLKIEKYNKQAKIA